MSTTKISKISIKKFRALNEVDIDFGDYISVICGKNGTSGHTRVQSSLEIFLKIYTKVKRFKELWDVVSLNLLVLGGIGYRRIPRPPMNF
jgi:predicted ATP-binding protein involved in virulence